VAGAPPLRRIVVAVDPAVSQNPRSDESGIVVVGVDDDGHGYVLDDVSGRMSPAEWGRAAVDAYHRHHADCIVAEKNQGGDLVLANLRAADPNAAVRTVHAARGKLTRAEPVAALYEQGRVHHVGGLPELEDQLCTWSPQLSAESPDRLDALVWAITELMLGSSWEDDEDGIVIARRSRR
jgi:predicted phage terminase large subunit-like protein